jgi:hypothetical protein
VDMKLEVVVVPVADVDEAKDFPDWPDRYAQYMVDEQTVPATPGASA